MSGSQTRTVPVSCNRDCIAGCPLLAHVKDGRLVKVSDNPLKGAMMHGCARGYQMPRVVYAADRMDHEPAQPAKGPVDGDESEIDSV